MRSATEERLILDFADTGMAAYRQGVLPDALAELALRLDLAGAGDLLADLCRHDWTEHRGSKTDPKPVPTPKPPPPPPPPPPDPNRGAIE